MEEPTRNVPFWSLFSRVARAGFPGEELLSVYRDYGVVEREGRDDNHNRLGADVSRYQLVEPGDLVVNKMKAWQGSLGVSEFRGIVSPAYFVYVPRHGANSRYLNYVLRSGPYIDLYAANSKGIRPAQWDLQPERLDQVRVPLPPLRIQRAIADYLDRETAEIDAMTADLDELETLLIERRRGTVETILLGGGTTTLQSLPEDWSRTTLGTVFSFHNGDRGVNYPRPEDISDEGIPFINAGDLINGTVDLEGCKRVSPEKYAQMGGAKLQRGDILFCLRGSLGKWGLMESDGGSLASSLCALRNERPDLVDVRYIAHAMSTRVIPLQIWFNESGSAQPNLGAEQVARFRVPLPPFEEQHRIVDEIDRETAEIDAMLSDITELRDLLAERRAAVIAAAVTGQIDIPAAEETTHA